MMGWRIVPVIFLAGYFTIAGGARANASGGSPFDATSVWNVPIPATASFLPVASIGNFPTGLSSWLVSDGVSISIYRAAQNDPVYRVSYHPDTWTPLSKGDWKTSGNDVGAEATILTGSSARFPFDYHPYVSQSGRSLLLPRDVNPIVTGPDGTPPLVKGPTPLKPTDNADGHLVIYQPGGRVFESYGTIVLSSGVIVCETYQFTDPTLAGDGFQNGVTASLIPVYAGLVTVADLLSGEINHAIKIVAPAGLLEADFTYPALSFDRAALTQIPPYSGVLPMGARLAMPPGFDLTSLHLKTSVGRMISRAAKKYGMIITDQGGAGITIIVEAGMPTTYRWSRDADVDVHAIIGALQRVVIPSEAYSTSQQIKASQDKGRSLNERYIDEVPK
jgi:hypothetical protein